MHSIRQANWKHLINPDCSRVEWYDIPHDPGEMHNLAWQRTLPKGMVDPEAGKNACPWPQGK